MALVLPSCADVASYDPAPLPQPAPQAGQPPEHRPTGAASEPGHPAPLEPLTLEAAIREALEHAPDLGAAAELVNQARADVSTASLIPNPSLTLGTSLQPLPGDQFSQSNPGGPPQYNLDIEQPLDSLLFGKRQAATESARRAVDVAGADLADLHRRRAADVAAAFYDVLEAEALLEVSREDVANAERVESLTNQRLNLGAASSIELDRARLALLSSRQDLRLSETSTIGARLALQQLLGRRAAPDALDLDGSLEVSQPLALPDPERIFEIAESSRPDLVSLRRQVSRWDAEITSQSRQSLPSLSAQFGFVHQEQEAMGLPNQDMWEASLELGLPVFDRNQGNVAKAESQARQARLAFDAGSVALRAEVEQAIALFRSASASVTAIDAAQVASARSVRDRVEAAYQAGGQTILELLDAERTWRDAQRLHLRAQSAYWHALQRMNAVVGTTLLE